MERVLIIQRIHHPPRCRNWRLLLARDKLLFGRNLFRTSKEGWRHLNYVYYNVLKYKETIGAYHFALTVLTNIIGPSLTFDRQQG